MQSTLLRPEIIVPVAGCAVAIVAIIFTNLTKMHRQTIQARLKEQMIDRGMSPEDMERVLSMDVSNSNMQDNPVKEGLRKPTPTN